MNTFNPYIHQYAQRIGYTPYSLPFAGFLVQPNNDPAKRDLSELLDQDTFLQFGYVPFVIAEVAWDYADTAIDIAILMRLSQTKKLCRCIRGLRREYLSFKRKYFDTSHLDSEEENMELFIDELSKFFNDRFHSYVDGLVASYPDLDYDSKMLISEAYLCKFILKALFKYMDYMAAKVESIIQHPIGRLLPTSVNRLSDVILEFAGDSPLSSEFIKKQDEFVDELVNQIKSIDLCFN